MYSTSAEMPKNLRLIPIGKTRVFNTIAANEIDADDPNNQFAINYWGGGAKTALLEGIRRALSKAKPRVIGGISGGGLVATMHALPAYLQCEAAKIWEELPAIGFNQWLFFVNTDKVIDAIGRKVPNISSHIKRFKQEQGTEIIVAVSDEYGRAHYVPLSMVGNDEDVLQVLKATVNLPQGFNRASVIPRSELIKFIPTLNEEYHSEKPRKDRNISDGGIATVTTRREFQHYCDQPLAGILELSPGLINLNGRRRNGGRSTTTVEKMGYLLAFVTRQSAEYRERLGKVDEKAEREARYIRDGASMYGPPTVLVMPSGDVAKTTTKNPNLLRQVIVFGEQEMQRLKTMYVDI